MRRESKVVELWPKQGSMGGLHLLVEWFGCAGSALLEDSAPLRHLCLDAVETAAIKEVLGRRACEIPHSRCSNSARLSENRWLDALTTQSRFGSPAFAITACRVSSGTNSSCVEWIAASGVGATRPTTAEALNSGSFGTPWLK